MIHNYVNLIYWKEALGFFDPNRDVFHCDSVFMALLLKLLRCPSKIEPGSSVVPMIIESKDSESVLFLTSRFYGFYAHRQVVLPPNLDLSNDAYIKQIAREVIQNEIKLIFIGVSSPLQNLLAQKLISYCPNLEIYCVGAVLDVLGKGSDSCDIPLGGTGFEWIYHMYRDPRRTTVKLKKIFIELGWILFSTKYRSEFLLLGGMLKH